MCSIVGDDGVVDGISASEARNVQILIICCSPYPGDGLVDFSIMRLLRNSGTQSAVLGGVAFPGGPGADSRN